ncbi:DUF3768 domain-containing protein [Paracoccus sp. S-4012]|nr:DUF3768 domain-containing protein [Paracoccus sp. S-4012]
MADDNELARRDRIRDLNDSFRRNLNGGRLVITSGIVALGGSAIRELLRQLTVFDDFTEDNDPYGEHDFGSLSVAGERVFWKIDAYAVEMLHGSPDAADPTVTTRVLTLMLASEY